MYEEKRYIDFVHRLTIGYVCRFESFFEDGNKTDFGGDNVQKNDYVHINAQKCVYI